MKVLVACEFSGVVRDAFIRRGHDAWSCDFLPTERLGNHFQADVRTVLQTNQFDLIVAHPPCTYLANSGVQYLHTRPGRWRLMEDARDFFLWLLSYPCEKVAVENPTPHGYANLPKYSQAVQPYEYGHLQSKRTCLWLKRLPLLKATNNVYSEMMKLPLSQRQSLWWGGKSNAKNRSRTFQGIADAMAAQWG